MKKIVLFVLLTSFAFAQTGKPTGAWLPVHVKWEHAPSSVNAKLETGTTTILYFDQQRNFAVVECVVNRDSGQYTISNGDGQVISTGEWDGHLPGEVKYRLVSRTVALTGESLPGPWHHARLSSNSKRHLLFGGKEYRRVDDLEPKVREMLRGTTATP